MTNNDGDVDVKAVFGYKSPTAHSECYDQDGHGGCNKWEVAREAVRARFDNKPFIDHQHFSNTGII